MDTNGINARVREFHEQNGGSANCVVVDNWILYSNGASRERNLLGALNDPPSDNRERAQKIVLYWKRKLDLAIDEFDNYKSQHLGHAKLAIKQNVVPAVLEDTSDVVTQLKLLQKKARTCKKNLQAAEQELEKYKPARQQELEEMSSRNRETANDLIAQLSKIEV